MEDEDLPALAYGEQTTSDEIEKIGACCLVDDAVAATMSFNGIAGVRLAEGMREQGLLAVIESFDSAQVFFGGLK